MAGLTMELKPKGIGVLILHPGGVKTRMGPPNGISPEESVRGMRQIVERFRPEDSGAFLRYDGVKCRGKDCDPISMTSKGRNSVRSCTYYIEGRARDGGWA